ncbi:uncharacterized protein LOC110989919 [Acanthaster planci]|uniref:Uncharacterized protein LOC110989919 n=1 Tax=Acanthaster planci TaxID=133434 RepID=A0A8B7ZZZ2_ACAPL|nr:uncharacterized protein LOC110989919 [Acanthaster planci]
MLQFHRTWVSTEETKNELSTGTSFTAEIISMRTPRPSRTPSSQSNSSDSQPARPTRKQTTPNTHKTTPANGSCDRQGNRTQVNVPAIVLGIVLSVVLLQIFLLVFLWRRGTLAKLIINLKPSFHKSTSFRTSATNQQRQRVRSFTEGLKRAKYGRT